MGGGFENNQIADEKIEAFVIGLHDDGGGIAAVVEIGVVASH